MDETSETKSKQEDSFLVGGCRLLGGLQLCCCCFGAVVLQYALPMMSLQDDGLFHRIWNWLEFSREVSQTRWMRLNDVIIPTVGL